MWKERWRVWPGRMEQLGSVGWQEKRILEEKGAGGDSAVHHWETKRDFAGQSAGRAEVRVWRCSLPGGNSARKYPWNPSWDRVFWRGQIPSWNPGTGKKSLTLGSRPPEARRRTLDIGLQGPKRLRSPMQNAYPGPLGNNVGVSTGVSRGSWEEDRRIWDADGAGLARGTQEFRDSFVNRCFHPSHVRGTSP